MAAMQEPYGPSLGRHTIITRFPVPHHVNRDQPGLDRFDRPTSRANTSFTRCAATTLVSQLACPIAGQAGMSAPLGRVPPASWSRRGDGCAR